MGSTVLSNWCKPNLWIPLAFSSKQILNGELMSSETGVNPNALPLAICIRTDTWQQTKLVCMSLKWHVCWTIYHHKLTSSCLRSVKKRIVGANNLLELLMRKGTGENWICLGLMRRAVPTLSMVKKNMLWFRTCNVVDKVSLPGILKSVDLPMIVVNLKENLLGACASENSLWSH